MQASPNTARPPAGADAVVTADIHAIGKHVHRKHWWMDGKKVEWYEPYEVARVTTHCVFVDGLMEGRNLRLSRASLERSGRAWSGSLGAIFYTDLPENYARQTVGFLLAMEPRAILGLPENFTPAQLKEAYRRAVRSAHPDGGGKAEDFIKVQQAYESLADGPSLANILNVKVSPA